MSKAPSWLRTVALSGTWACFVPLHRPTKLQLQPKCNQARAGDSIKPCGREGLSKGRQASDAFRV